MRFKRMVALQNERRQSIENKVIIQNKSHLINTVCVRRRSFISWCDPIYVNFGEWVIWSNVLQDKSIAFYGHPFYLLVSTREDCLFRFLLWSRSTS